MSLNIKNERTHALVRELAQITGMSQTSAVEDAVRRRLDELSAERPTHDEADIARRKAAIEETVRAFHAETTAEQREGMTHHDWLYDDMGLPA